MTSLKRNNAVSEKDAVLAVLSYSGRRAMGGFGRLCGLWLGAVLLALLALSFIGAFIALGERPPPSRGHWAWPQALRSEEA